MSLQSLQDKAVGHFADKHPGQAFDPAVIFTFGELIMDFIARLQDCRKTSTEAREMMKSPTRWQKRIVASKVRKEIGRREFQKHGKDIVSSLLSTGAEITHTEIQDAYDEV